MSKKPDLEIIQFQLMPEKAIIGLKAIIYTEGIDAWGLAMRAYALGFIHGVRQERTKGRKTSGGATHEQETFS